MSAGVAGSNFWIPIYALVLGLDPRVAFWCALLTMLFGFGSGVVRNWQAGTLDRELVRRHAPWVLPSAAVGALLAPRLPVTPLLGGYAIFVLLYGLWLGASTWSIGSSSGLPKRPVDGEHADGKGAATPTTTARARGVVGGLLQGLIATGAGSLLMPAFLDRRPDKPASAVGSTVLMIFLSSLIAAFLRIDAVLWRTLVDNAEQIRSILLSVASGALVAGQLGPRLASKLPALWLRRWVALILVVIGVLVAQRVFGG